jgi:Pyridoxamine 5'-phosphate oxidase
MSIPVDVADLEQALADFGAGYLMTVSGQGSVKVVTVEPTVQDGVLVVTDASKGTVANLAGNPQVTLVFPPPLPKGFSLLVDGTAEVAGRDVRVTVSGAVLHRPSMHFDGPPPPPSAGEATDSCANDCAPVTSSATSTA